MSLHKYIAEFRYVPVPGFLDIKGETVDRLLGGEFEKWEIKNNRIDVNNKETTKGVFIGFENSGFAVEGSEEISILTDMLVKGINNLSIKNYRRFGFRSTSIIKTDRQYESLLKDFETLINTKNIVKGIPLSASVEDVETSLLFKSESKNILIQCGPMKKEQAKLFFNDEKSLPDRGVYIDIDYYLEPSAKDGIKELRRFLHFAKQDTKAMREHFIKLTIGDNNGKARKK